MSAVTELLLAAADRIEANPHLNPTAKVSAAFPRGILTMTVRAQLAGLRDDVAGAERVEHGASLAADYYSRWYQGDRTAEDSARYAATTSLRATAARRALRDAELAFEAAIVAAINLVGPIAVGTTRGQLAGRFRTVAADVSPVLAVAS
ncbi:hypothetical protein ACFXJO_05640 [Streptomyces lavendulae]|uniref:hypothetical protein n=1 Tax=Streptomyces lavendulae TaxID=1914 RepID=UPI0036B02196